MNIFLEKRPNHSVLFSALSPFLALGLTLIFGAVMFSFLGKDPGEALYTYFILPLTDAYLLEQIVLKDFQSHLLLPMMMIMGMFGGMVFAAIPAILKSRFGTNEILTSLMLVYIAQQFVDWLVRGPWRDPNGMGFPGTKPFNESAVLPDMLTNGDAHYGAVFAVLIAVALWIMLSKTLKGFEITVLGQSPRAGRFSGFDARKMTVFAFLLSGALAGLAGISEVSGSVEKLDDKLSLGYGFTAIIVAFLGRLNPRGIVAAGLVLALSYIGGDEAKIALQISNRATSVFQGLLLFFVLACDTLIHYRIRFVVAPTAKGAS